MNEDTKNYEVFEINDYQEEVTEEASSIPERKPRKKPRQKKKRKKKYYSLRILGAILFCVVLYFFLHSSVFTIEKIELDKNDRFSLEQIKELSGLKAGMNMFEVKLKQCEDKLEDNPYIREADLKRQIPDVITVTLDMREPVAVIIKKDKYIMIDREGTVLEIREKLPYYTVLDGITVEEAEKGGTIKVKEEKKYDEYMKLLDKVSKADLYFREIQIDESSVKLYARKSLYCTGTKENMLTGIEDGNLKAVLYNLSKKGIKSGVVNVGDDKYYSYSKVKK